ncbi:MAG: acyl-ACP--UDP-N-acetylglucosamine O-acyltransferase [Paludibacteraceae bacterium]|nr:acyl-ACP--UDP-N-acetylglucosamine O-acyltransferase [Paludibacteraceae bacterium]
MIQEMSFVHPEAKIGKDVEIAPFVYIDKDVEIGDGCQIMSHATILSGARIGKNVRIFPGAVISAIPQDLKFKGEVTTAVIGDNTTIRECATVNRGTASKGTTIVGSNCLIMAYSHIAHDCKLGNNIIIGNASQIAGEVVIDDWAILSGSVLVHQFSHIGSHVIIQGGSRVGKDVPPYITAGRDPLSYAGLNLVGLRRRGFSNDQIREIQEIYRLLYQSGLNTTQATEKIINEIADSAEKQTVVAFLKSAERGIIRGYLD